MAVSVLEELKRFEKDTDWIFARYSELANQYPEEYVAVYECKVVGHGSNLNTLMKRLRTKYGETASAMAIHYVSPRKDEIIL